MSSDKYSWRQKAAASVSPIEPTTTVNVNGVSAGTEIGFVEPRIKQSGNVTIVRKAFVLTRDENDLRQSRKRQEDVRRNLENIVKPETIREEEN